MNKIHKKLIRKSDIYHRWNSHPSHCVVHWLILAVFSIVMFTLIMKQLSCFEIDSTKYTKNYRINASAISSIKIAPISASEIEARNAKIEWHTNIPSSGEIAYGQSKDKMISAVKSDAVSDKHSVYLSGLKPDKKYYFQIKSRSTDGRKIASSDIVIFQTKNDK